MFVVFFFFKQKAAYELRISDWSSDVCSSDLPDHSSGSPLHPFERRPIQGDTPLLLKLQRDPNGLLCAIAFETIHGGPNSIFSALGDILRYRERIAAWPRIIKRYAVIPMQIGVPCHRQDRKSTRLNPSHSCATRMPSSACTK